MSAAPPNQEITSTPTLANQELSFSVSSKPGESLVSRTDGPVGDAESAAGFTWMPGAGARCANQRLFVLTQPQIDPAVHSAIKRAISKRLAHSHRQCRIRDNAAEHSRLSKIYRRAQRDFDQATNNQKEAERRKDESVATLEETKAELQRVVENDEKEKEKRAKELKIATEEVAKLRNEWEETNFGPNFAHLRNCELPKMDEADTGDGSKDGGSTAEDKNSDLENKLRTKTVTEAQSESERNESLDADPMTNVECGFRKKMISKYSKYYKKVTIESLKESLAKEAEAGDNEELLPAEKNLKRIFDEMDETRKKMESSKEEIDSLNQTKSELIWLMKQVITERRKRKTTEDKKN